MILSNVNPSKLEKWRAKYGAAAVAFSCLLSMINSWGNNWVLTVFFSLGVLICGAIGFFDIKRARTDNTSNE
ncbi:MULTISPECIES: hypothetical protein [unclassified Cytobacillus]|uniref:hypothetical protein n=1 Tax=unclassified Cytobacillus TaxID=2675268 RepID=UPI00135A7BC0|nr:hypothetical protein [Cytobacillus sp. AMY 15.2]MCM3090895.1 hypothetical protein [Cytobacillus sp. AMY 15.2]